MNKIPYINNKANDSKLLNENCVIINPIFSKKNSKYDEEEIFNLAENINLKVKYQENIKIRKITPSLYFGKGQVDNFKIYLKKYSSNLLLINTQISPVQQRNLELIFNCKILDRTGLILEIFGERAVTKHGKLQVELASLTYQKSRLVRSWTHLERQRGGYGFMGGPGERQIESDKRQINKRISKIKNELKKIESNKLIQRTNRNKNSNPFISLVGYTNAGKSTLFNFLTKEKVFVKNQLFATLDTTMRKCFISPKKHFILSDTVGFIKNLPTELVVSFKTTLDEINYSDYLLHVIDVSNPEWENQKETVEKILQTILGVNFNQKKIIEVWNKFDLLNNDDLSFFNNYSKKKENTILFSSKLKLGKEKLLELIKKKIRKNKKFLLFNLPRPIDSKKIKPLL
ncbi:MAG: GTPase HflX [Alphaproteobacteria bacterium MarineAlpha6_Bin4]|nr:MAG: GTPase HflX [Alphaproteobacteria bacterium MarineAlpha6_Bin3]PPR37852.1 MAG: GTPase HflX [Alphaproteobacteria bacterium MarineAlpha6_Bin4]